METNDWQNFFTHAKHYAYPVVLSAAQKTCFKTYPEPEFLNLFEEPRYRFPACRAGNPCYMYIMLTQLYYLQLRKLKTCFKTYPEPEFVNLLRSPGIDSHPGGHVWQLRWRTGPPGYRGWRNWFLGIDSGLPNVHKIELMNVGGGGGKHWGR